MGTKDLKEMGIGELIAAAIRLDQEQKKGRITLSRYKGELERRGQRLMDDMNTHYVKFFSTAGKVGITDSSRLDILNPDKLKELIGEGVYKTKIKENVKTEYKVDAKLERALKAIFQTDYTFEQGMEEFLQSLHPAPDTSQLQLLMKKLKGDYEKDRAAMIEIMQLPEDVDLDVELWYIYKIKNAELIKAFLPEEGIDWTMEAVRKCILLDSKTSVTLDYEDEKNGTEESA